MYKTALPLCCTVLLLCAACSRPQDESSSKFQRQANIEKYVRKARAINRLNQERENPLPVSDPVDISALTNQTREPDREFFFHLFARSRRSLEQRMLRTYGEKSAAGLSDIFEHYREAALAAAREVSSPGLLAEKLRALRLKYDALLDAFISAQEAKVRLLPDQSLLEDAQRRMELRGNEYLDRIAFYYGNETAGLCRPVLQTAVQDFAYAMAGAADEAALSESLRRAAELSADRIKQITVRSGDPLGITPEELITSLRAEMIAAHHILEERIETLYGKDAVLQARTVFNRLLDETGRILRESARLSQKKRTLSHLNAHYRADILALQKQWNNALDGDSSVSSSGLSSGR